MGELPSQEASKQSTATWHCPVGERGLRERPGFLATERKDLPKLYDLRPHDLQGYFDHIYSEYMSLTFVPAYLSWGWEVVVGTWPEGHAAQNLYKRYGWPDTFRKQEFVEAVKNKKQGEDDGPQA